MALSDLHALIGKAAEEAVSSTTKQREAATRESKRAHTKLVAMQRKVFFFVVWTHEQESSIFEATATLVQIYGREKRPTTNGSGTAPIRLPNK